MTKRKRFAKALRARYAVADGGPGAWWGLRQSAERGRAGAIRYGGQAMEREPEMFRAPIPDPFPDLPPRRGFFPRFAPPWKDSGRRRSTI